MALLQPFDAFRIVAVAVNSGGRREVLGMAVGASEAETFWTEALRALARRGLRGVKLVISDAHEGLKAAAARVLHASWQRCRVHFMRNVLAHEGKPTVAVSSPPFPRRRAGVALTSVPKFARLFAGGNWIRNCGTRVS